MSAVHIAGVAMTRFGKLEHRSVKDLTREAVLAALTDAGSSLADMDVAFFANATQGFLEGQNAVPGQIALRTMGLKEVPIVNVENACASGSTAFYLACTHVRAGQADTALAIGCEKMYGFDKKKTFALFNGGWDVHKAEEIHARLMALGEGMEAPAEDLPPMQKSAFLDVYAAITKHHMKTYGLTQKQLAMVAAKNHDHSVHNPLSQYRKPMAVEEILSSPTVAWPLTVPMCSPISDGAAAVVVCNSQGLRRLNKDRSIKVLSSVLASSVDREWAELENHITRRAALRAYEMAGYGPEDMSLAEVHDATAFGEIVQTECLGFCEIGGGGELVETGATRLGGKIPVNVSGGLESKGHPVGATGLAQLFEVVTQLRAEAGNRQVENMHLGIAENGGGFYGVEEAAACITILGR